MGTVVISHKGLGVEVELPKVLKQRDLEMFEDELLARVEKGNKEFGIESVNNGIVISTSVEIGWLDKNLYDDISSLKPNIVKWLSGEIYEHTRKFLLADNVIAYIFDQGNYDDVKIVDINGLDESDFDPEKNILLITSDGVAQGDKWQKILQKEYELPELLQKHIEKWDTLRVKRAKLVNSVAGLYGNTVRIACELNWINMEKTQVSAADPKLIQVLSHHIDRHVKSALEIPKN